MQHNTIHGQVRLRLLIAATLSLGFLYGCAKGGNATTASALPRKQGSPHHRLKWKAEDYFADAGILLLCKAIEAKDTKEIDRLVKSGVNVNAKGRGNMTPLLWAFPMGENMFRKLLEMGADPNVMLTKRIFSNELGLGCSAISASVDFVDGPVHDQYLYDVSMDNYLKIVLENGGNPNLEEADGQTPLFHVAKSFERIPDKVKLLLDAKADIDHRNTHGQTALLRGVFLRRECLLCLLSAGADYRIADNNGWDFVLSLANARDQAEKEPGYQYSHNWAGWYAQPIFDWLTQDGVNMEAARAALKSPETMINLKNLPADYKHRPWLPQRPTLKKPAAKAENP
jgi:hypothetical protein